MILMQTQDLIATGGTRECYRHPGDPSKVIKISRKKPFFKRKDPNWQEWRHYQYLMEKFGPLDFIGSYYGFVETCRGRGLMSDYIYDHDGQRSRTLEKVLLHGNLYDLAAVRRALNIFCRRIIEKNIQLFDLNLTNILIKINSDGSYRPVAADIKGRYANLEFIPVSTYIPSFSRRKITRRCRRLLARVGQEPVAL